MGFSGVSLPQCHNRKTGGETVVRGKVTEGKTRELLRELVDSTGLKCPLLICQWSLQKSLFHGPFHVQMIEEAQDTINISRRFGCCH